MYSIPYVYIHLSSLICVAEASMLRNVLCNANMNLYRVEYRRNDVTDNALINHHFIHFNNN